MNIQDITFKQVKPKDIKPLMIKYHYLHRTVGTSYAFAMYLKDELVGMVGYSRVRQSLAQSISEEADRENTLELSRLFIKDKVSQTVPNITSKFVSWTLRQLKKYGDWFIISFADSGMHHTGAIYQATNFLYCGTTKEGIYCYNGPDKKGGQWKAGHHYRFFLIRSKKYRYIQLVGTKTFIKYAKPKLKFEIKPYPKGDEYHYGLNDYEERFIRDRKTNKVYSETELLKAFPNYNWNGTNENVEHKPRVEKQVRPNLAVVAVSTKSGTKKDYASAKECTEDLGIAPRNLRKALKGLTSSLNGYVFCYKKDYSKSLVNKLIKKAKASNRYPKDVIIDGIWYGSTTEAREALGKTRGQLNYMYKHSGRVSFPTDAEVKERYLAKERELNEN